MATVSSNKMTSEARSVEEGKKSLHQLIWKNKEDEVVQHLKEGRDVDLEAK
jgi:hypothetical protein